MAREKRGKYAHRDRHPNSRDENDYWNEQGSRYPVGEFGRDFLPGDEGPSAEARPPYPIGHYGRDYEPRDLRGPQGARDLETYGGRGAYELGSSRVQGSSHRGRGPRGYKRSDERIHDDVCERLTDDHFVDASEITISVADGEVTLSGSVASRDQKRRAEVVVDGISGVLDVHNRLRLDTSTQRTEGAGESAPRDDSDMPGAALTDPSGSRGRRTHH